MMEIITICPFCNTEHIVTVDFERYLAWQSGELIQNALPNLSADERELLKTGICSECWDKMFQ